MTRKEMRKITAREIDMLENMVSYFSYHNKNLNAAQYDYACNILPEIVKRLDGARFAGYDYIDDEYLKEL